MWDFKDKKCYHNGINKILNEELDDINYETWKIRNVTIIEL